MKNTEKETYELAKRILEMQGATIVNPLVEKVERGLSFTYLKPIHFEPIEQIKFFEKPKSKYHK